ncbi:alpha/beta hydrolase [Kitasatospora cineracea]|uniref:alpha/beta hydrolase n=1 Tax=Kitasatospora cineracea TaxID=88074 RepID=UPI00382EAC60
MHFTSDRHLDAQTADAQTADAQPTDAQSPADRPADGGVREREFTLDGIPGVLWTPAGATADTPVPLILLGHPALGLRRMHPRLLDRARRAAADGFASAALELPGSGERPRVPALDLARAELRRTMAAGDPVGAELIDALVLPLVDQAVPELRSALDALLALPELTGPVGYSGGVISVGVRLAAVEPRIAAAGLFAGSFIPRSTFAEARRVTVPLHVLLQWDDEGNDRQASLDLFDAFASPEKSLSANMGGHTGVPAHAGDAAGRFFARHLKP